MTYVAHTPAEHPDSRPRIVSAVFDTIRPLSQDADRERVQRIVEPILQRADIVTPSDGELRAITGIDDDSQAVEQLLDRGVELVARTRGADGCTLYTPDETVDPPSVAVEEVDPTGAGDVFARALVVGWSEGMVLGRLEAFANAAGAQAVTARGPMEGVPDRETVEAAVADLG